VVALVSVAGWAWCQQREPDRISSPSDNGVDDHGCLLPAGEARPPPRRSLLADPDVLAITRYPKEARRNQEGMNPYCSLPGNKG
jgi:hypothetical protein